MAETDITKLVEGISAELEAQGWKKVICCKDCEFWECPPNLTQEERERRCFTCELIYGYSMGADEYCSMAERRKPRGRKKNVRKNDN